MRHAYTHHAEFVVRHIDGGDEMVKPGYWLATINSNLRIRRMMMMWCFVNVVVSQQLLTQSVDNSLLFSEPDSKFDLVCTTTRIPEDLKIQ